MYGKMRSWEPITEKKRVGQLMTGKQCVASRNYHLPQQEMGFVGKLQIKHSAFI